MIRIRLGNMVSSWFWQNQQHNINSDIQALNTINYKQTLSRSPYQLNHLILVNTEPQTGGNDEWTDKNIDPRWNIPNSCCISYTNMLLVIARYLGLSFESKLGFLMNCQLRDTGTKQLNLRKKVKILYRNTGWRIKLPKTHSPFFSYSNQFGAQI